MDHFLLSLRLLLPSSHHKTNHKHHKYNVYKYWNRLKYYSSHLINKFNSHLHEIKNTPNMNLNHLITPCKSPACSNTTTHYKTNHKHHKYNVYKYWNRLKYYSSHLINKFHSHLHEVKNTSNMNLNHLITPCKPPAYSNTTTHHKTNHKHHKYNVYKYWKKLKYYSSHLINKFHLHLHKVKNTLNMNLNHLITLCKPPACSNTTTHHKTNHKHHKYRVFSSIEIH